MAPPILSPLAPADLLRERLVSSIDLSRDGERIAYSERTVVGGKDRSSLWIVPFGSGRPRRLTHGAWSDSSPRFSPDGRSLAFLSDREKSGVSQLLVLPLDGGDPKPLTTFKRGVSEAEWMPDGRSLAVVATDDESYDLHGERKGDETATVRVLRHVDWRMDGDGLLDHRRHVHVVTLGGRSRRLTRGPWSAYHVRPHPGGTTIGFIADRGGDEIRPDPQVHVVEVKSGRIRQRSKLPGEVTRFSFDPDGTPICIAFDRNPPMDEDPSLVWRVAGDGSGLLLTEGMESFAGKQGVRRRAADRDPGRGPRGALPGHRRRAGAAGRPRAEPDGL